MRALFYILLIRFKNRIKSLVKSPGALILVVILLALLLLPVLTGDPGSAGETTDYRSMEEVYAIMTAFYCIAFVMGSYSVFPKAPVCIPCPM